MDEQKYIEIKKMAYQWYGIYNSLDRPSRKLFLDAVNIPNDELATEIVKNTLLIPDTIELVQKSSSEELYSELRAFAEKEDNIDLGVVGKKAMEYNKFKTRELIKSGKLSIMEGLAYPDNSICKKEYIALKKEALDCLDDVSKVSLKYKWKLFEDCLVNNTYQEQIQVATVLIPNDAQLISELQKKTIEELAEKYKVPTSVILFKQEEYNRQDTTELIQNNELPTFGKTQIWCGEIDEFAIGILEEGHYKKAYSVLAEKFSEYRKKVIK